ITAARFKARSYSTPAMPYQRATELSPTRWSAKVLGSRRRSTCPEHIWCARSTRFPIRSSYARPTVLIQSLPFQLPATMARRWRLLRDWVRDAGFEPVVVGKLVDARRFQRGAPGYGQSVTAAELRQKLSLTP